MDEILIEEKKYVSSKRAAKMTGYAKDYVGQLCREGRVPARLVGRSWYVLETAIQDHRFGDHQVEQDIQVQVSASAPKVEASTREVSRYEASTVEVLPSINRLRSAEHATHADDQEESPGGSQLLQDSWRAWFDHVGTPAEQAAPVVSEDSDKDKEEIESGTGEKKEGDDVNIPVNIVYEPLPKELLPTSAEDFSYTQDNQVMPSRKIEGTLFPVRAGKILSMLIAVILAIFAVIGSGYFDAYVISVRQVDMVSGITLYNK